VCVTFRDKKESVTIRDTRERESVTIRDRRERVLLLEIGERECYY